MEWDNDWSRFKMDGKKWEAANARNPGGALACTSGTCSQTLCLIFASGAELKVAFLTTVWGAWHSYYLYIIAVLYFCW